MRLVFGLVLLAGLALAGFAVHMAKQQFGAYQSALQQERDRAGAAIPTRQVYVATRALVRGEELKPNDIRIAPWPVEILPEGVFGEQNPLFRDGEDARVVVRAMDKFDALTETRVSAPGGDAGLTSQLRPGERAFAIRVDVASGVSGFLRPGDRVDVYWTGRMPGSDANLPRGDVTRLIETGVRLIAIDQKADASAADPSIARTVTVAISPQQVAGLAQAQSTGRLSLSLMAVNDESVAEAIEMDQRQLLGLTEQVQVVQQAAQVCNTRVRRGADVVEIPIPCPN
ncbi:pilus assembly protein CpaB [Salipiger aestuarii]|uniref:Pilus assembly protein CpaB n=1 Tax=Salipiger aestuarii TaxID=568098 RepID=A0A327YLQ4_9RHOB|nr:Flp pilus assembly protein CpaB [Salipiger aestuarii]EIE48895.1 Flp pilus assembly protein CpaB [Citreicella sp. 357]KAA8610352.1 pilus assembly protein CpaB [Salipiger aestuarii]KAA8616367.1 pilus assembly protein CpaB [Salipiger aestuarii]KAB2543538.1 pilus assembly protein CpaB [Salipiger aestuarii]RAK21893.1 pilus assembly protein CpaB [Salipiger aestuarii]